MLILAITIPATITINIAISAIIFVLLIGTVIGVSSSCTHNYRKSGNCCGNGYGNYVLVSHPDGTSTMYAHLQSVYVSVGDSVSGGQALGAVGCTGFSTGFHLHYEIRVNGKTVDPQQYL